jgi:hypothetical protein
LDVFIPLVVDPLTAEFFCTPFFPFHSCIHSLPSELRSLFHEGPDLWLDWATIQFRFYQHCQTYTGSFCVFGPVLSSPAHAAPYLAMPPI